MAATDKNDQKTKNLKHKPNYIHINMYSIYSNSKYKKIQQYKMVTLITNTNIIY